jgi:hypothetical protein
MGDDYGADHVAHDVRCGDAHVYQSIDAPDNNGDLWREMEGFHEYKGHYDSTARPAEKSKTANPLRIISVTLSAIETVADGGVSSSFFEILPILTFFRLD